MGLDSKKTILKLSKPVKIFLSKEIKLLFRKNNSCNCFNPLKMDASNDVSRLMSNSKYCNGASPLKMDGSNEVRLLEFKPNPFN